jgi:hypothetical protein
MVMEKHNFKVYQTTRLQIPEDITVEDKTALGRFTRALNEGY